MSSSNARAKATRRGTARDPGQPRCGRGGATDHLTRTACCPNWICDDADQHVLFSYARNSCYRNHDHYTLWAYHSHERHPGDGQTCERCRADMEPAM